MCHHYDSAVDWETLVERRAETEGDGPEPDEPEPVEPEATGEEDAPEPVEPRAADD